MIPAREEAKSCISMDCEEGKIIFCADFWALWGAGDFLPKRTAALAVDGEGGNSPVLLQAFLATDM